jgi:hypothetical protein
MLSQSSFSSPHISELSRPRKLLLDAVVFPIAPAAGSKSVPSFLFLDREEDAAIEENAVLVVASEVQLLVTYGFDDGSGQLEDAPIEEDTLWAVSGIQLLVTYGFDDGSGQ